MSMHNSFKRLCAVCIYAIAMAWVEAAVVVYLRVLIQRLNPYQANPLPVSAGLGQIEMGRELATMVMLAAVGYLAGQAWRSRVSYALIAFGVWDIFYYIFLVPMSGWPHSILDWDVLFLLPLPWWGPVLAPVLISALLILGGVLITQGVQPGRPIWPHREAWLLNLAGAGLALYAFMATALRSLAGGELAVRSTLPAAFNWPLFGAALGLLAAPLADMGWQLWRGRQKGAA
jgi:hypothetical protein